MSRRWLVALWEALGYLGLYYGVAVDPAIGHR
jgi:hypothetical protein